MPIPKYNEMYRQLLEAVGNGRVYSIGEDRKLVAQSLKLSAEDLAETLPSNDTPLFNNRPTGPKPICSRQAF